MAAVSMYVVLVAAGLATALMLFRLMRGIRLI